MDIWEKRLPVEQRASAKALWWVSPWGREARMNGAERDGRG